MKRVVTLILSVAIAAASPTGVAAFADDDIITEDQQTEKISVSNFIIKGIESKIYTGEAITCDISVICNGQTLIEGQDYAVSYTNNTDIGKAYVKISGIGNYNGTLTRYFTIKPMRPSIKKLTAGSKKITVKLNTVAGDITSYQIYYKKTGATAKKVKITSASKVLKSLTSGSKYKIKVRAIKDIDGKNYISEWSSAKSVTVK